MTIDEIQNIKKTVIGSRLHYTSQSNDYDIHIIYSGSDVPYTELSEENTCTSKDIEIIVSLKDKKHPVEYDATLYNKNASIKATLQNDQINIGNYETQLIFYKKMYDDIRWIIDNILYELIPVKYIDDSKAISIQGPFVDPSIYDD